MKWSNRKILITGGAGFIGSNLVREIVRFGGEVTVLDNFSSGSIDTLPESCQIIRGDVRDVALLNDLRKIEFDIVFHFGGPSSIILFNNDESTCVDSTIVGTKRIFDFCRDTGVSKIVYASSSSVYGDSPLPQTEETPCKPCNLYGISKLATEHIAACYSIPSVGLRIFAGYGPGETKKGNFASVITLFLRAISRGDKPVIYGDGTQSRDFVYIDDIVRSALRAAESNFSGIINVGSGESVTFNEVVDIICTELGRRVTPEYRPKPPNYIEKTLADIRRLKSILGVEPRRLKDGLRAYLASGIGF
jgi:UDP-glucose 4-epimerase